MPNAVDNVDNQVIADLSRAILVEVAPEELPLFSLTSQAYFQDPDSINSQGSGGKIMGSGLLIGAVSLTPFLLPIMTEVVNYLAAQLVVALKKEAGSWIGDMIKKLFNKSDSDDVPALTTSQLQEVNQIALKEARRLGLPDAKAKLLAASIVGNLAIS